MGLFPTQDPEYARIYAEEAAMVDAGEMLARALEHAGVTRTVLAERLGVSKSEITERLRGERNVTVRKLAATLHALGCRLELEALPIEHDRQRAEFLRLASVVNKKRSHSGSAVACGRKVRTLDDYQRARKVAV